MTTVTYLDLERFSQLCGEIRVKSDDLAALTAQVAVALPTVPPANMGDATKVGMATAVGATEAWGRLLEQFEREALHCLGERRHPGEGLDAFFTRICKSDLLALIRRNGVRLAGTR